MIIAAFGILTGPALGVHYEWAIVEAISDDGIDSLEIPLPTRAMVIGPQRSPGRERPSIQPGRRAARLDVFEALAS